MLSPDDAQKFLKARAISASEKAVMVFTAQ
jgi:hypothetical protein